jgi:hypothetical protein
MTLKFDVETDFIAEVEEGNGINGFRMIRQGQRTRFRCKRCGHMVHEQFTPAGKLPPLLWDEAIPDYACNKCGQ